MGKVPREAGLQEEGCCRMDPLLRVRGVEVDSSDQQKFWRIISKHREDNENCYAMTFGGD